ncbi:MAG: hypothetical protein QXL96_06005 [Ignisphaera sp.]
MVFVRSLDLRGSPVGGGGGMEYTRAGLEVVNKLEESKLGLLSR